MNILNTGLSRRFLSGFKSLPKQKKQPDTSIKKYDQLTAPEYQLGFKKPESGILEVETGRIIGGKKEVKVIESDQAYRARLKDARQLNIVRQYLPLMPFVVLFIIFYIYIFLFDATNEPPQGFQGVYQKRKKDNWVTNSAPFSKFDQNF